MANSEHLAILQQALDAGDIGIWNQWRKENPDIRPDLGEVNLSNSNLGKINFRRVNLAQAQLVRANLMEADLRNTTLHNADLAQANLTSAALNGAHLPRANLYKARLVSAHLEGTNLMLANLEQADLNGAALHLADLNETILKDANLSNAHLYKANLVATNLINAQLYKADLTQAVLERAYLMFANLTQARLLSAHLSYMALDNADLAQVICGRTTFADIDLSQALNLDTVQHIQRSHIDIHTLYNSKGKIPEVFLRGCGVPKQFIASTRSAIAAANSYYSCFISYSHKDSDFAHKLAERLANEGILHWIDSEAVVNGENIRDAIARGVEQYDIVLLCASEHSLTSEWVAYEIELALAKESKLRTEQDKNVAVLRLLDLDGYLLQDSFMSEYKEALNSRLAINFHHWQDDDSIFEREIEKVIRALRTDGGKQSPPESKL